jgi:hypothetical protein
MQYLRPPSIFLPVLKKHAAMHSSSLPVHIGIEREIIQRNISTLLLHNIYRLSVFEREEERKREREKERKREREK